MWDIKPFLTEISKVDSTKSMELEILKLWFLNFLEKIEGVKEIKTVYNPDNFKSYNFSFKYEGFDFYCNTIPPNYIQFRHGISNLLLCPDFNDIKNILHFSQIVYFNLKMCKPSN